MTHRLLAATLLVALFPAAGCTLYFGDDGPQCSDVSDGAFGEELRDPNTGACTYLGGGGGGGCYDYFDAELPPDYDWASCYSGCEGLDEASCAAADSCRGAYYESCPECDDISPPEFYGCWGVAPSGPVTGGEDCAVLDAYGCSRRNDCQAVYGDAWGTGTGGDPAGGGAEDALYPAGMQFLYCQAEPVVQCGDQACPPGSHCEETCYPTDCACDPNTNDCECPPPYCESACVVDVPEVCLGVDCGDGYHCEAICPEADPTGDQIDGWCYAACEPDNGNTCEGVDCGDGYHCVEYCDGGGWDENGDGIVEGCYPACEPDSGACGDLQCAPGQRCGEQCVDVCEDPGAGGMGVCWTECFPTCIDEGQTCEDGQTCPDGSHCSTSCLPCDPANGDAGGMCGCVTTCEPDLNGCAAALCGPGTHCEESCFPCDPLPDGSGCEQPFCQVECVPDQGHDPGECYGEVACDALPPACPEGSVPGILGLCWSGFCIPEAACDPANPGECFGAVTDDQLAPTCPDGTTPGVLDGRYTGFCIPLWACETVGGCESFNTLDGCLSAEAQQLACAPTFVGTDCSCDAAGNCSCANLEFDRCVSTSGGCENAPMPDCAAPPDGCDYVGGGCVDGAWTCGELVCFPAP